MQKFFHHFFWFRKQYFPFVIPTSPLLIDTFPFSSLFWSLTNPRTYRPRLSSEGRQDDLSLKSHHTRSDSLAPMHAYVRRPWRDDVTDKGERICHPRLGNDPSLPRNATYELGMTMMMKLTTILICCPPVHKFALVDNCMSTLAGMEGITIVVNGSTDFYEDILRSRGLNTAINFFYCTIKWSTICILTNWDLCLVAFVVEGRARSAKFRVTRTRDRVGGYWLQFVGAKVHH